MLWFIVLRLFYLVIPTVSQTRLYPPTCNTATNYTPSSAFAINLKVALFSLASNAYISDGFYNTTHGEKPDKVYGLLQCKGDISAEDCKICGNISSSEILRVCRYQKEAVVYFDNCWLRYAYFNFFTLANTNQRRHNSTHNYSSNPTLFSQKFGELMHSLSVTAASDSSRFATAMANFWGNINVYLLVQCTRDLYNASCLSCLQVMISYNSMCCDGKISGHVFSESCNIRFNTSYFYPPPLPLPPQPLAVPLALQASPPPATNPMANIIQNDAPPPPPPTTDEGMEIAILTGIGGPVLLITLSLSVYIWRGRYRAQNDKKDIRVNIQLAQFGSTENGNSEEGNQVKTQDIPLIPLKFIQAATNSFSSENKLGQGGFGPVYKGIVLGGKVIAVKRLSQRSGQGLKEFKNEVRLISKLQHKNRVRLLGYCVEEGEKLLIYEYMPNSSLDSFLFDPIGQAQLDWKTRYNIVIGIARVLLYLHEDSRLKVIHRDLKASNVLLDHEMNPKRSDFGLAKIFGQKQSEAISKKVVGTLCVESLSSLPFCDASETMLNFCRGYIAPEYARGGQFSVKSDVYSFGVLLLEIISGKKNSRIHFSEITETLLAYAWRLWNEGKGLELMDPLLEESCVISEIRKCVYISLLCVQENPADRPTMSYVMVILGSNSISFIHPSKPAYCEGDSAVSGDHSVNEVTITSLSVR